MLISNISALVDAGGAGIRHGKVASSNSIGSILEKDMAMGFDELKVEITEYHLRIEEVLSGMDAMIQKLQHRADNAEQRIAILEGQLAALSEALL